MYEDKRNSKNNERTFFRNFPYNSLGKNQFITGDAANNNLIENTNTALAAQEARLSVEVVQREEGDLRNITSLSELAQALAGLS